jgi:hypothetical protein
MLSANHGKSPVDTTDEITMLQGTEVLNGICQRWRYEDERCAELYES